MIKVLNYMANTAQAKKRARQSLVRRERNVALKSKLRTFVKNVVKAIEAGDKNLAGENYKIAVPVSYTHLRAHET